MIKEWTVVNLYIFWNFFSVSVFFIGSVALVRMRAVSVLPLRMRCTPKLLIASFPPMARQGVGGQSLPGDGVVIGE